MKVNIVYPRRTIQGEGPFAGRVCTFVRLYGCNLHCAWCDSAETWDTSGRTGTVHPVRGNRHEMTATEVARKVTALGVDMCVITGGEPLIQRSELTDLARQLSHDDIAVHIETNGTLAPGNALDYYVEHYAVSPKLPHADAGDVERVINLPVLRAYARMPWRKVSFKTVVRDRLDIDRTVELYRVAGVDRRAGWIMPEGITAAEVHDGLADLIDYALEKRLNVSGRMHIDLWGNERGR